MRYWIETRYPPVTEELLHRLYFHRAPGKLRIAQRMAVGNRVLQYETKRNPDAGERGSQTILAMGTVRGEIEYLPRSQARRVGGRLWDVVRDFDLGPHVPLGRKDMGVPLPAACEVLGRSENPRVRRTKQVSR